MTTGRPIIHDLKRTSADLILEALAFLGLLLLIGVAIYYYPKLPDSVPRHFNFSGEPDGWGAKGILLGLPAIGTLIYILMTVLSRYPHIFNYPWPITEANARSQYAISRQMLTVVKLLMVGMFFYMNWSIIGTALGRQHGLGGGFMIFVTPLVPVAVGFYLFKARRAR